jgi:hypothetical protein
MMFSVHGGTGEKDRKFVCYQDGGNYYWEQTAPDWREEAATTIKEGLVGHWTFNEGSGTTAYDYSGNNNHGTLSNPNWPQGQGWAMDFNGTSDYVEVPHNDSLNTPSTLTAMAWVYWNGNNSGRILQKDKQGSARLWEMGVFSSKFRMELWHSDGSTTIQSADNIPLNEWMFLTMTFDGTDIKMYQNGTQTKIKNFPGDIKIHSDTPVTIGGLYGLEYFPGLIDDVRIYNRALSASEITDLYNGKEVSNEGLVGWWAMNEGEGTTVTDLSGNGNDGTINGATWLDGRGPTYEQVETTQGQALNFNGVSDYVEIGELPLTNIDDISIGAWINRASLTSDESWESVIALEKSVGFLRIDWEQSDNTIYGYFYDGTQSHVGKKTININTWYHVAFVKSENSFTFYVDGVLTGVLTGSSINNSNGINAIGTRGNYMWNGQIDDVRIYNRALRPEEIRYLYETTYRD